MIAPFFFRPSGMLCSEDQPGEGYVYDSDSFIKIISGSLGHLGTKLVANVTDEMPKMRGNH
jgi:hypothetical protein